ncbi:SGNH/GDSL hydrolase family protein [Balneola vulgaris]|uniref:SGNH/GDSL hydrolase family protein n=1 Tax=Balneola vulgaris TaxID=287535 RepID=UPI00037EEB37|nr:SGNH/GDSL hydrolase family protein [Balneola vulgaris]
MKSKKLVLLLIVLVYNLACTKPQEQPLKYLALGDSYTIGEAVPENGRWPVQLVDSLQSHDIEMNKPTIVATTGWTTNELQKGIDEVELAPPYDLVSLLIGVNNQYRGYDIEIYREEFRALIEQSIEFAGGDATKVFVVSIPNYGVTPFGMQKGEEQIRTELLAYDAMAAEIAFEYNIPFINITPISEGAKTDSTLIASDELHPSEKQYTLWVEEILPIVKSKISEY